MPVHNNETLGPDKKLHCRITRVFLLSFYDTQYNIICYATTAGIFIGLIIDSFCPVLIVNRAFSIRPTELSQKQKNYNNNHTANDCR